MKLTENFNSEEFNCKCGKCRLEINPLFVIKLQLARTIAGIPFKILSGCRCNEHNEKFGGVKNSAHTRCLAADIEVNPKTREKILSALRQAGFIRIGKADSFLHCDIDKDLPQMEWKY